VGQYIYFIAVVSTIFVLVDAGFLCDN